MHSRHVRYVAPCLALVLVPLCAFVGVVAVGRLADGLVALGERAQRRGRRCDRRREPAELEIVGDRWCVPDAALIHGRRDEARGYFRRADAAAAGPKRGTRFLPPQPVLPFIPW